MHIPPPPCSPLPPLRRDDSDETDSVVLEDEDYEIEPPPPTRLCSSPSGLRAPDDFRAKTYSMPFADGLLESCSSSSASGRPAASGSASLKSRVRAPVFPLQFTIADYLSVRVSSKAEWRKRYFVLKNNFLLYAPLKEATAIQSAIYLDSSKVVTSDSTDLSFTVRISGGKKIHFRADDSASFERWLAAVTKAAKLKIKDIYRLLYTLGTSASQNTKVIAAKHRETGDECAIKIVDKRKCDIVALHLEIQILKQLSHAYIVSMKDLFETKKYLYIVMEHCKGGELFDAIAALDGDHYSEEDCLSMMHQMSRAVQYMHDHNVVHRDLKPENVLCVNEGSIEHLKIADFGISKITYKAAERLAAAKSAAKMEHDSAAEAGALAEGEQVADLKRSRFDSTGISEMLDMKAVHSSVDSEGSACFDLSEATSQMTRMHYLSARTSVRGDDGDDESAAAVSTESGSIASLRASAPLRIAESSTDAAVTPKAMRTMVGTMTYTAPEVLSGVAYDRAVDYWSLGVIMYILLCGYPPFWGESDAALVNDIVNEPVIFEDEDWDHVSQPIVALCKGLLEKDPRRRRTTRDILNLTVLKVDKWKRLSMMTAGKRRRSTFKSAHGKLRVNRLALRCSIDSRKSEVVRLKDRVGRGAAGDLLSIQE